MATATTGQLSKWLEDAITAHQPPMIRGRRIKLRYAHMGGHNPPMIIIHGNQVKELADSYVRYLKGHFRKCMKLVGTPIQIQFKSSDNPFKETKPNLNLTQIRRKRKLMAHVKRKKPKRRH